MTTSAATLLVYLAAALTINAIQIGKMTILLLLVVSGRLLAVCNESVDALQTNGFRVRRKGKRIAYRRRLDLANQLVEESGEDDWAVRLGMTTLERKANRKKEQAAEEEEVAM
jgi:hypothetical protein